MNKQPITDISYPDVWGMKWTINFYHIKSYKCYAYSHVCYFWCSALWGTETACICHVNVEYDSCNNSILMYATHNMKKYKQTLISDLVWNRIWHHKWSWGHHINIKCAMSYFINNLLRGLGLLSTYPDPDHTNTDLKKSIKITWNRVFQSS